MQKLIVIIFDGRSKARAGLKALRDLDRDGELSLFEVALAVRGPNGRVRVIENPDDVNFPAVGVGSLTGSVLGALGGPIGIVAGAAAGALIGFIINLERAGVTDDFVNDVSMAMAPGKFAVVADVLEDSTTPLDERMEPLGGVVFRRTRSQVRSIHHDRDVAAHRAEMERLKAERAQAKGEHLDKIDAALDRLGKKLERALLRERSNILRREEERDARIGALRAKADQSQEGIRQRLETRIAELQREYEHQDTDAS
jgi:uncharacterized membrane protein